MRGGILSERRWPMRSVREIQREIREHKADMKARGLRITSFMNRQDSLEAARANERLFALKVELADAKKAAS